MEHLPYKQVLLGTGCTFFAGMMYFYRKKQTVPFKVCYGLMWPTLGSGIIFAVSPSEQQMAKKLGDRNILTGDDLGKRREANAAAFDAVRRAAGQ